MGKYIYIAKQVCPYLSQLYVVQLSHCFSDAPVILSVSLLRFPSLEIRVRKNNSNDAILLYIISSSETLMKDQSGVM